MSGSSNMSLLTMFSEELNLPPDVVQAVWGYFSPACQLKLGLVLLREGRVFQLVGELLDRCRVEDEVCDVYRTLAAYYSVRRKPLTLRCGVVVVREFVLQKGSLEKRSMLRRAVLAAWELALVNVVASLGISPLSLYHDGLDGHFRRFCEVFLRVRPPSKPEHCLEALVLGQVLVPLRLSLDTFRSCPVLHSLVPNLGTTRVCEKMVATFRELSSDGEHSKYYYGEQVASLTLRLGLPPALVYEMFPEVHTFPSYCSKLAPYYEPVYRLEILVSVEKMKPGSYTLSTDTSGLPEERKVMAVLAEMGPLFRFLKKEEKLQVFTTVVDRCGLEERHLEICNALYKTLMWKEKKAAKPLHILRDVIRRRKQGTATEPRP